MSYHEIVQEKIDALYDRDADTKQINDQVKKQQGSFLRSTVCDDGPSKATSNLSSFEHKGLLSKRSPRFFVGWQERYFVLKDRKLAYYQSEQ